MKTKKNISTIITLCITLFVTFGCTKQNEGIKLPFCGDNACLKESSGGVASCAIILSFLKTASPWPSYDSLGNSSFAYPTVIMGEILDETYQGGRKIRIIEDFRGHLLPREISTIMVWTGFNNEPLSCSDCYKTGDTLIMALLWLVLPGGDPSEIFPEVEPEHAWILTLSHAKLISCSASVLWLKNGFVMGQISGIEPKRMSWRDFQRELNSVL